MNFISKEFVLFLIAVFILYWFIFVKKLKYQNLFILIASYVFYGWWDWRFLGLILFSTIVDYTVANQLNHVQDKVKRLALLWTSIFTNISLLAFFKYFNFFLDNLKSALTAFGSELNIDSLKIILPVGISFYTFQTLSYTIDVYRKKLKPTTDFIEFAAYVSFFPQLVAGPIERARHLLPQFSKKREFNYLQSIDGLRQMLWGTFKKMVIADNCARFANQAFGDYENLSGSTLVIGAIFFAIQIYGDFSGYSDIAIGTSKLFGFTLKKNFAFPYFSRDVAEFWRRWHISLSTWFRDYVYIPLGGSQGSNWSKIINTLIIFIISGFWHGANWTFIFWGLLNAIYFLPLLLTNTNRKNLEVVAQGHFLPSVKEFISISFTFCLIVFAWIFFRSETLQDAFNYIDGIVSPSFFQLPHFKDEWKLGVISVSVFIFFFIEWIGREHEYAIEKLGLNWKRPFRYALYYAIILAIVTLQGSKQEFIYFQF